MKKQNLFKQVAESFAGMCPNSNPSFESLANYHIGDGEILDFAISKTTYKVVVLVKHKEDLAYSVLTFSPGNDNWTVSWDNIFKEFITN